MRVLLAATLILSTSAINLAVAQTPLSSRPSQPRVYTADEISDLAAKAAAGDAKAQTALGRAYADGNGVPQDFQEALRWYRKASSQGNGEAENEIGILYRYGN